MKPNTILVVLTLRLHSVLMLIAFVALFAAGSQAYAGTISCNVTGQTSNPPAVGAASFGRDAPIGSTTPAYSNTLSFHCPGDPCCDRDIYLYFNAAPTALVAGYNDVYPTNLSGIGVRFTISNGPSTTCNSLPVTVPNAYRQVICHQLPGNSTPGYDFNVTISAQFVKTGAVAPGALTTIPALSISNTINNQSGTFPWGNAFTGTASGNFSSIACSVTQSAVQVTMPQANTKDLASVGATTGSTLFSLSLNCDPGVRVAVTLSDLTTPSNRSNTLSLTADSTAKGIAYQVSYAGTPILYGADSSAAGTVNQISVSSSPTTGGVYSVPLKASYIRTGTMNPGSANAKATFTMSYQ
ncbi:hypothetical protein PPGU19_052420 [Paraburkholderia sp. PGU19]|uniref:fimbrial protein n=1 Tax=Paraburkholderia sp. PGU19 TaxID=2735434 RepID=UPI0015D97078|nr:fimbrial protein [Paraburkholderia sp. PGU19]BCG00674.1 hypothetical protein PPGU19_052420 [Paraburkholderia sp. PGU19]